MVVAACGGEDEEGTPEGTKTSVAATQAGTGTPAVAAATRGSGGRVRAGSHRHGDPPRSARCSQRHSGCGVRHDPQGDGAYFNYVNDTQGGVCGRKIVYKVEDNNDDPARALEVTRKLVEQDKVFAMVGNLGDPHHSSALEYLNEDGVPDLLVSAGAHRYGADPDGYPWTVQMIPDYRIEANFFGQYISENLPGKKVAVLYENRLRSWMAGGREGEARPEQERGSGRAALRGKRPSTSAPRSTNMKNTGAEVAILYATPGFTAQAIKAADRLGWKPQFMASYINSDDILFQFVRAGASRGRDHLPGPQAGSLAGRPSDRQALRDHAQVRRAPPQQLHRLRPGPRRAGGGDAEPDLRQPDPSGADGRD